MQKNLIIIDNVETLNALEIFTAEGADKLINEIKDRIVDFDADIETAEGRDLINTSAFQVGKVKNAIDKKRVSLVADEKAKLKTIDAAGGKIWDFLEEQQKRIRKPLDDYEAAEEKRILDREERIADILNLKTLAAMSSDVEKLKKFLQQARDLSVYEWQEFFDRAEETFTNVITFISTKFEATEKADADRKELEELRRKQREQEQKDRDEKIRKDAEEETRKKIAEETEKKAAASVAPPLYPAGAKPVNNIAYNTETKLGTISHASLNNDGSISLAVANIDTKAKINNDILASLTKLGLSNVSAKAVIVAIVNKQIPYVSINYEF